MFDRTNPPPSTSAASAGSSPAERVMRIAPLDLKQQRFRTQLRGFDRTEVVAFLTEAADDYEHALREIDRLRQDLVRQEALLDEHRDREANLRNTCLDGAEFIDATLENACLAGAKLPGADLKNADLSHTDFTGADLDGANLNGSKQDGIILDGASLVDTRGLE